MNYQDRINELNKIIGIAQSEIALYLSLLEPVPPITPIPLKFRGVNLAGAEFGESKLPGIYGQDYIYPTNAEVDYFMSKGMNTFRLPFKAERLNADLSRIKTFVDYVTGKGGYVLIDMHNYARYNGAIISATILGDLWTQLASLYKGNDKIIFGLMNEPHDMADSLWLSLANNTIARIRSTGAKNLILVGSNNWSHDVIDGIVDTNWACEIHMYFDGNGSGQSAEVVSETIGSERMMLLTAKLKTKGIKAFIGEFGVANNQKALACLNDFLKYIESYPEYIGWTYWAAGPWWGDYMYSVEPAGGVDKPQMTTLSRYLKPTTIPLPVKLITNEFAYFNPNDSNAVKSSLYEMTSGSVFEKNGKMWTGKIDNIAPNATSSNGTNSAVFRMTTKKSDYKDIKVSLNLEPLGFTTTPTTPAVAWDGAHIFLRYVSQYSLYYASVCRRDGKIVIKKKVPGGPSNNGTYHTISPEITAPLTKLLTATIKTLPNQTVQIQILNPEGTVLVTAIDSGVGGPPILAGKTGLRLDNLEASFDFTVVPL